MSDDQVSYVKYTENFTKARRNYTISAVTIIVLAAANTQRVKIPGIDEANLPNSIAFSFLLIAMIYFVWEYIEELQYTRLVNSKAAENADIQDKNILGHLRESVKVLSSQAVSVSGMEKISLLQFDRNWYERLDNETIMGIKSAINTAAHIMGKNFTLDPLNDSREDQQKIISDQLSYYFDSQFSMIVDKYESYRTQMNFRVKKIEDEICPQIGGIVKGINENRDSLIELGRTYETLSKRIYRSQRISLQLRDTWLAIVLGVLATVLAVSKIAGITALQCSWAPNIANLGALHSPLLLTKPTK